tara:strand:+ start:1374 stop:1607 length:234 start_codon:yes stop_codon:yes gene_type:complete
MTFVPFLIDSYSFNLYNEYTDKYSSYKGPFLRQLNIEMLLYQISLPNVGILKALQIISLTFDVSRNYLLCRCRWAFL